MNIKRIFWALLTLSIIYHATAQTNVVRYDASKANDYGIVYTLPKTQLWVEALVEKKSYTPGQFSAYALKYLNQTVGLEPTESYRIVSLRVRSVGVPDTNRQYVVEFRSGTMAPFVTLTSDGILNGINSQVTPTQVPSFEGLGQTTSAVGGFPSLPQEYNLASSKSKQAEIAARYLFYVRESSMNIITGDVDQMPKDGQAMKIVTDRLRHEERATMALFAGDTVRQRYVYTVKVEPSVPIQNMVLFRFSTQLGPLTADNLAGEPVKMTLNVVEKAPELTEKELEKKERSLKGVVYNMPGIGDVQVDMEGKVLYKGQVYVTQWGTRQSLAPKMFKDNNDMTPSIIFDVNTGGITSIKSATGTNL